MRTCGCKMCKTHAAGSRAATSSSPAQPSECPWRWPCVCSVFDAVTVFQMVKDDYEDDAHVFRKAANDITSQLEINFGNLPRPGRGARGGTRGGRGRIRRAENYGPRAEVVVSVYILNPGWFSEVRG